MAHHTLPPGANMSDNEDNDNIENEGQDEQVDKKEEGEDNIS